MLLHLIEIDRLFKNSLLVYHYTLAQPNPSTAQEELAACSNVFPCPFLKSEGAGPPLDCCPACSFQAIMAVGCHLSSSTTKPG